MSYFYILEILESEIQNAKNILEMNYSSLSSLNDLKIKFEKLLQRAIHLNSISNSNSNINSNVTSNISTYTTNTSNINSFNNNEDDLNQTLTTPPSQNYMQIITNKIKEMDNEIAYINTLNKQQKYRLKQLNKQINFYLLNINVI